MLKHATSVNKEINSYSFPDPVLTTIEQTDGILPEFHESSPYWYVGSVAILYPCSHCKCPFPANATIEVHKQDDHATDFCCPPLSEPLQLCPSCHVKQSENVQLEQCEPALHGLHCYNCDLSFEQFCDLSEHVKNFHNDENFNPCVDCELFFHTSSALEVHIVKDHERMQQFDGPIQEQYDFSDSTILDIVPNESEPTVRTAKYAFNKNKQMKEIKKDAKIPDFDVTVNNDDENCTIKCSSGFYIQVARSSFTTIDRTTVITIDNVAISVQEVKITTDKNNHEANRLIHFLFFSHMEPHGGVAVHLHHSTRTIQVQGGSLMPDSSKAALWFVNKVIIKRFNEQAKAKKYAVKNFNEALQGVKHSSNLQRSSNSCQFCSKLFNTQSKPSLCTTCSKFFHKIACLKDHQKACHPGSTPARPSLTPAAPSGSSRPPTTPALSWSRDASSSSVQLPSRGTDDTVPDPSHPAPCVTIPGLKTSISFVPQSQDTSPEPCPSLPSNPSSSSPSLPQHITAGALHIPALKTVAKAASNGKRKAKAISTTKEDINVEFLQRELVAAQARITQLDATIGDKEMQVTILLARVKAFEERENAKIYEKYFPQDPSRQAPPPPPSTSCPAFPNNQCSPHQCCSSHRQVFQSCPVQQHSCAQSHHCCTPQAPPDLPSSLLKSDDLKLLLKLENDVNEIKATLRSIASSNKTHDDAHSEPRISAPTDISSQDIAMDESPEPRSSSKPPETLNISLVSVEELIPDNPLNFPHLN